MRYIAFDLETTGFLPGMDQITEIGAVRFNNGQVEAVFSTLVNPRQPIPPQVVKITGISDDMVDGKPTIDSLLESFAEFCGDDLIVAHNAPFDVQFFASDIKKFETNAPGGLILDTCAMARKILPGLPNYKLGTLIQHLDIDSNEFHRAEADATYCGKLFWYLLRQISSNGQMPAIENLISLSNNKALRFPVIERKPKQMDLFGGL